MTKMKKRNRARHLKEAVVLKRSSSYHGVMVSGQLSGDAAIIRFVWWVAKGGSVISRKIVTIVLKF